MEHLQRNTALLHAVDKAHNGLFIVIRRKGGGQPQSEGPLRRERRFSGQICVAHQHLLHGRSVDHEIL